MASFHVILSRLGLVWVVLGVFLLSKCSHVDDVDNAKCGYSSCPAIKKGYYNIHLIPHTHDDVGWLKTPDQYYFGNGGNLAFAGVQYILDSVVRELNNDPKKRFIYVETFFFWKWWNKQNDETQRMVKMLVKQGRLEFIGGAWTMNDEACTHYQSIIDQFTWGFRKLNDTFGKCGVPRVGWQIDPFGHSREDASLMARFGFDAMFFGRTDWRDKTKREENKTLEMVWEASANLGDEADLFTGILYNTYSAPDGFSFDVLFENDPIIDDMTSPDYNADAKAEKFLEAMNTRIQSYQGSNIACAMGDDFNYQAAHIYFVNIDRLIQAVNARQVTHNSKVNLIYSTPSCYAQALNNEGLTWPTKQDDFYPYASDWHSYWAGYFSSRPAVKRYERMGNNYLQVCKQLYSLSELGTQLSSKPNGDIDVMREAMGVMQHHDAITGTERQLVASEYQRILSLGFDQCNMIVENALNKLMSKSGSANPVFMNNCLLLNISQCSVSETSDTFVVTLYNPLSRVISRYVRIPVAGDGSGYSVYNCQGQSTPTQVVPIPQSVIHIPGRTSEASVELVFRAQSLPPLGFRSYYITKSNKDGYKTTGPEKLSDQTYSIGFSDSLQLTFNGNTNLPKKIKVPDFGTFKFQQSLFYYEAAVGNNQVFENRSSGAYIFRPNSSLIAIQSKPTAEIYKGDLVHEVHQTFSSWASQVIRAYKEEDHLEFNWVIGPIPVSDEDLIGKEIVSKYFMKDMVTNSEFYTDSNGREMLKRVLNYRPTFNYTNEEPISGNYYPIVTRISLKDQDMQMSVLPDRAEGGASLNDGEIELMVHRRLLNDDAFGVAEALNETAYGVGLVVRGKHWLTVGANANQSAADRRLIQSRVMDTWTFLTPTTLSLQQWQETYNMEYSGLKSALPDNVQILTLEPWRDNSFLLRLEHILEKNDDNTASDPITIDLQEIFEPFIITSVQETSLGANQWKEDVSRLVWKKEQSTAANTKKAETRNNRRLQDGSTITLNPMEIKTFVIQVAFK